MSSQKLLSPVNTNPMIFEELATSLATLATFARDEDMSQPLAEMDHLYRRALQEPPGYAEITSLTGHSLSTIDRKRGRAAWLLMNVEGLEIYGVHSRVWHKVGNKYSAPILDQVAKVIGVDSRLSDTDIQEKGEELALLDVLGIKGDSIWLIQVVNNEKVADSAIARTKKGESSLFRSQVYEKPALDEKSLRSLRIAYDQMTAAFPEIDVMPMVLVLHPTGPDFELYQADLPDSPNDKLVLEPGRIKSNSIDYADKLVANQDCLFSLPHLFDDELFCGIPPCRGGRTLGMLASAATRQLKSDSLLMWERKHFIEMLRTDFNYEVESDKVRHDLDDRLVAQGFFRKWASWYYVSMKGIARYQYCLAKFTNLGLESFQIDDCISQRDKIIAKFGCVG